MSSALSRAAPGRSDRWLPRLGLGLALAFFAANALARALALHAQDGRLGLGLTAAALAAGVVVVATPRAAAVLELFGASFLLFGFHSYRPQSQVFELLLSGLAAALCLRALRRPAAAAPLDGWVVAPAAAFAVTAALSLLLLPLPVVERRVFLEGEGLVRALLAAFPKDPLYGIVAVDRLWLLALTAALVAVQPDARSLYHALFRGVAWSAIAAAILGLLDFTGVVSFARYNLSHVFYGAQYRRLQSTFSNPSWFASFVVCALPFVWLAFHESRRTARFVLALAFMPIVASLVLAGARAAWLLGAAFVAALLALSLLGRSRGPGLARLDGPGWLAIGSTLAALALLVGGVLSVPTVPEDLQAPPGRLEGLSREMRWRGVGLQSPRWVVAQYAIELARPRPLLGLGHESFNMHLRAQLAIEGSPVARVVNTAVQADARETVFDDSHNTYLQVLTGTGAIGLALWLLVALAGLAAALRAFRAGWTPEPLAVLLGLALFHLYGLFQGMTYIPMTFALLSLLTGYACVIDPRPRAAPFGLRALLASAVVFALAGYAADNGYSSLKRRFGVEAYLPDDAAEFEGFYRPETSAAGEFRWMAHRGIVNLRLAAPFRLTFVCGHPDLEREPVVVSLSFEGSDLEPVVCRRPGPIERRFALASGGALRLEASRTFRPGGSDRRELGVAVSAIRWE